jgi:hypothetical protein
LHFLSLVSTFFLMRNPRGAAGKIRKPEKSQRGFSLGSSFDFEGTERQDGATHRTPEVWARPHRRGVHSKPPFPAEQGRARATRLVSPEKVDTLLPERSQTRHRRSVVVQRIVTVAMPG